MMSEINTEILFPIEFCVTLSDEVIVGEKLT